MFKFLLMATWHIAGIAMVIMTMGIGLLVYLPVSALLKRRLYGTW
jgi:hypothetical protein